MSAFHWSPRNRTLAIAVLLCAAVLGPLPAALAWPAGTCEPAWDKGCVVDVSIAKTSDRAEYAPGDVATYTITVTNTGNTAVDRARVQVSDAALADLTPTGAATGWLSPGETMAWTGTRTLTTAECGPLQNTATVTLAPAKKAGPPDADAGNDTATRTVSVGGEGCAPPPVAVVPAAQTPAATPPTATQAPACPRPMLAAVVRGAKRPKAGRTTRYRVTVYATTRTAHRVTLRLTLPRGFSLPRTGAARLRHGRLAVNVGTVTRGRPRTVRVLLRLDRSTRGRKTMKASVRARCGGTAAGIRTVRAVAVPRGRMRPAVTG